MPLSLIHLIIIIFLLLNYIFVRKLLYQINHNTYSLSQKFLYQINCNSYSKYLVFNPRKGIPTL